jgi:hypothetical protein
VQTCQQPVLHVRLDLFTADPLVLGQSVKYIQREVRPAVERQPGILGLSLLASPQLGVAVLESFWATLDALRVGEEAVAPCRELAGWARGNGAC